MKVIDFYKVDNDGKSELQFTIGLVKGKAEVVKDLTSLHLGERSLERKYYVDGKMLAVSDGEAFFTHLPFAFDGTRFYATEPYEKS